MSRELILQAIGKAKSVAQDVLLYISRETEQTLMADGLAGTMGPHVQARFTIEGPRALPTIYGLPVHWDAVETKVVHLDDLDPSGLKDMIRAQKRAIDILIKTQQRL